MKTIGLIGGMSPESTVFYYKTLNRLTKDRFGGHASAKLILHSVNFADTHAKQRSGDWDSLGADLASAAKGLERAGADLIGLATNTMHKCAPQIVPHLSVPFLHIGEVTADALKAAGKQRPALLGTGFTMNEGFYTDVLMAAGLSPVLPDAAERLEIDRIIFDELVHGHVRPDSQARYIAIVDALKNRRADSVILGCTEIGMLLNADTSPLPVFDTALLHCLALIEHANR